MLKTPENFNNDIGTPLTLLGLAPEHQAAVIETGMNHFGEIRYLGEMVRPDIAVISNIGDAHIEYLGSREGILKAKCEIFETSEARTALAVLNGDDALLQHRGRCPSATVRCGQSRALRRADQRHRGSRGGRASPARVTTPRDAYRLTIPAPGEHMAYSASMAVAVGEELGLSREEIVRGVAVLRARRLPDADHPPAGAAALLLDDCYNANPQSVTAALEILAKTDVRPEGGGAGRYGRAGGPDGPGPLQRGRSGGHAGH